jgi:hypothetical protein
VNTRLYLFQKLDADGQPIGSPRLIEAQSDAIAIKFAFAGSFTCRVATTTEAVRLGKTVDMETVPTKPAKVKAPAEPVAQDGASGQGAEPETKPHNNKRKR